VCLIDVDKTNMHNKSYKLFISYENDINNNCTLQKRQICKKEQQEEKLYSLKQILSYKNYAFEFPWEKKSI